MLASTHFVSGVTIGLLTNNPAKAFSYGFLSHFVLDSVPHWGGVDKYSTYLKVAVCDGFSLIALSALVYKLAPKHKRVSMLAGALGAVFPDFDKPSMLFSKKTLSLKRCNAFIREFRQNAHFLFL